ncbi:MAG: hypothetical protein RBT74_03310 [Tenuifilaceae bacterium]|jgi:hypothetical protein|nr:hypothetical protein [Tenuifilaceae bacterium]
MFRKIILLAASAFLAISSVFGQSLFRDGYVVNAKGDTLNGLVQYFEGNRVPQKITFKRFDIATPRVYLPNELMAFGYRNGNHFESKTIDGVHVLLECYVKGEISLYANGKKVYVSKANVGLVELTKDIIITEKGNSFSNHIKFLTDITSDVKGVNIPADLTLNPTLIAALVVEYNSIGQMDYQEYNRTFADGTFSGQLYSQKLSTQGVGFMLGIKRSSASVSINELRFSDFNQGVNSNSVNLGLFYTRQLFKVNNAFSLQAEVLYTRNNYLTYGVFSRLYPMEKQYLEISVRESFVCVPVAVVYTYPAGKISPFVSLGVSYSLLFKEEDKKFLDVQNINNDIYTYSVDETKTLRENDRVRLNLGLGVRYRFAHNMFALARLNTETILNFTNSGLTPAPYIKATDTFKFKYLYGPTVEMMRKSPIVTFSVGVGINL